MAPLVLARRLVLLARGAYRLDLRHLGDGHVPPRLVARDALVAVDLDWRPTLWERAEDYPPLAAEAAASASLLIGNEEEVEAAGNPEARALILKRGERGSTVFENGVETDVPVFPVDVVNGLGAGDAFAAAVGHGLLGGLPLVEAVRRGSIAGAIVASRLACSEAMPRLEELEAALV